MVIDRDKHITDRVVFVDGLTGTGKTMLTPILSTFDRMELPRIEHIYEYICALHYLGRIEEDAATTMLRMYVDIAGYNTMIGRETNFRWTDLSGVWRNGLARRYIRRLFEADGDSVLARMEQRRPILPVLSHQALGIMRPLFVALGSRLFVIEMVRHPLYLLEHWYSYIDRHGTDPRDFTVWITRGTQRLPWFASGWEEQYTGSNKMDRVIYTIQRLTEMSQKTLLDSSEAFRSHVITIPFERFVQEPWPYLHRVESALGTKTTSATLRVLRKQKVPRKLYSDGPDRAIYRRYRWRPPAKNTTEAEELETRWKFARREASKSALDALQRMSADYEQTFLQHQAGRHADNLKPVIHA